MLKLLSPEEYPLLERFVASHPAGVFTQSPRWRLVKEGWGYHALASLDENGEIRGALSLLEKRVPVLGCLLYGPRGPVCDYHDEAVLSELCAGADTLARQRRAYLLKLDPDLPVSDTVFPALMARLGFAQAPLEPTGFATLQCRFNHRFDISGASEETLLASFSQKTRYNLRLAQKKGVEVRSVGEAGVEDFGRLMQVTGQRDGFAVRPALYFARMLSALGENARLYLAYYEGEAVSGALGVNYAGKTCYVYGASDDRCRNVMPNYLVQWELMRWALSTGCRLYDMQGVTGAPETDAAHAGLNRFKRGFGGYVDELPGEFDRLYRPLTAKLVELGIKLR